MQYFRFFWRTKFDPVEMHFQDLEVQKSHFLRQILTFLNFQGFKVHFAGSIFSCFQKGKMLHVL